MSDDQLDDVVDEVSAGWDDDDRLEDRRAAARAALELLRDRGRLGRTVATEELLPEYAVDRQDDRTWWRRTVRPVLSEVASYSRGRAEYVLEE